MRPPTEDVKGENERLPREDGPGGASPLVIRQASVLCWMRGGENGGLWLGEEDIHRLLRVILDCW